MTKHSEIANKSCLKMNVQQGGFMAVAAAKHKHIVSE